MSQDENYSKHYDEFRARVDSYRSAGVEVPAVVWTAILDLGNQISVVRHDVVVMEQANEVLDAKLFGWKSDDTPDFADGGIFGAITREIKSQTQELKDNNRWIMRLAGGILVAALAAFFQAWANSHGIHWP